MTEAEQVARELVKLEDWEVCAGMAVVDDHTGKRYRLTGWNGGWIGTPDGDCECHADLGKPWKWDGCVWPDLTDMATAGAVLGMLPDGWDVDCWEGFKVTTYTSPGPLSREYHGSCLGVAAARALMGLR